MERRTEVVGGGGLQNGGFDRWQRLAFVTVRVGLAAISGQREGHGQPPYAPVAWPQRVVSEVEQVKLPDSKPARAKKRLNFCASSAIFAPPQANQADLVELPQS